MQPLLSMVQGNNQSFASPVNRVKITGLWASRSLTMSPSLTFAQRLREYYSDLVFRVAIFSLDLAFWATRMKQWVTRKLGWESQGFEDELERTMRGFAKSNFGVEVAPGAFDG
jgi:aarF domain-containing kinase